MARSTRRRQRGWTGTFRRAPHVPRSPAPTKPIALRFGDFAPCHWTRLETCGLGPRPASSANPGRARRPVGQDDVRPAGHCRRSVSSPGSPSSRSSSARLPCPAAWFRDSPRRASSLPHRHQPSPKRHRRSLDRRRWSSVRETCGGWERPTTAPTPTTAPPLPRCAPTIRNRTARLSVTSTRSLWRSRPGHGRSSSRPRGTRRSSSVRMRPAAIP